MYLLTSCSLVVKLRIGWIRQVLAGTNGNLVILKQPRGQKNIVLLGRYEE